MRIRWNYIARKGIKIKMYKRIRKNKEKFLAFAVSCMVLGMPQAFAAENTGGGVSLGLRKM